MRLELTSYDTGDKMIINSEFIASLIEIPYNCRSYEESRLKGNYSHKLNNDPVVTELTLSNGKSYLVNQPASMIDF